MSVQLPTVGAGQSDLRVSCELDWEGAHCPPLQGYLPNSSAVHFPGPFLTVATESLTKPPKREGCVPARMMCRCAMSPSQWESCGCRHLRQWLTSSPQSRSRVTKADSLISPFYSAWISAHGMGPATLRMCLLGNARWVLSGWQSILLITALVTLSPSAAQILH